MPASLALPPAPTVAVVLADGRYDVIVVDATTDGPDALRLELTVLDGEHKGEVLSLRSEGLAVDELEALGMPGTLTVDGGEPALALEH
jgi:hypothetical protein